jgi:hypothetical protein
MKKLLDYLLAFCSLPALGITLTANYFLFIYLQFHDRFFQLKEIPLNEIGDFFAGIFGPIAFLWLVIGYLMQNKELKNQINEFQSNTELQKKFIEINTEHFNQI